MKTKGQIVIERPIEEVFDFTIGNVPKWCEIVIADEVVEETPDGVGTRFRILTQQHGTACIQLDGEVVKRERPYLSVVRMTCSQFEIEAAYTFEDLGGRTRVEQLSVVKMKGFLGWIISNVLGGLMSRTSSAVLAKDFARLKQLLENPEPSM